MSTPTHCEISLLSVILLYRYGYRPIPSEIDTAELLKLRTTLVGMKNDVHLMDKWLVSLTHMLTTNVIFINPLLVFPKKCGIFKVSEGREQNPS